MKAMSKWMSLLVVVVSILTVQTVSLFSQDAATRAALAPAGERKPAPAFSVKDSAGNEVNLTQFRGKTLVLDFWATWCHGCKQEIPWFVEFDKKYRSTGLAVVGVAMDDDGWKVVAPFIKSAGVPYQIVLGDEKTSKSFHIEGMPDTFLIDSQGRIAAVYNGMVDRENIENNIKSLLAEK